MSAPDVRLLSLQAAPEWTEPAADWFHRQWGIPAAEYRASMAACLRGGAAVPQWYVAVAGGALVAGAGVIENDFHGRKDLAPNLCALCVEPAFRGRGLAGRLLAFICRDMARRGVATLYLVTEHTGFYERYGWDFLGMTQEDGTGLPLRLYGRTEPEGGVPWRST